jgi:hypothetical protein
LLVFKKRKINEQKNENPKKTNKTTTLQKENQRKSKETKKTRT